jgi:hypothetical protein
MMNGYRVQKPEGARVAATIAGAREIAGGQQFDPLAEP